MFKGLIIFFILLINIVYAQWRYYANDYTYYNRLNYTNIVLVRNNISYKRNNKHLNLYLTDFLKLTASTRFNNNLINEILIGNIYDIASYDIRFKIYISNRVSLTNRFFIAGFNNRRYVNTISLSLKF
jgi:hypothetical protein